MDMYATVVGFFQEGGPFMYPIAIVLAIGVAIAVERYLYLANQMRVNRKDYNALNLSALQAAIDAKRVDAGQPMDVDSLVAAGVVRRPRRARIAQGRRVGGPRDVRVLAGRWHRARPAAQAKLSGDGQIVQQQACIFHIQIDPVAHHNTVFRCDPHFPGHFGDAGVLGKAHGGQVHLVEVKSVFPAFAAIDDGTFTDGISVTCAADEFPGGDIGGG